MNHKILKIILDELLKLPKETEWVEFKEASTSFDFHKLGKYFSALSNEANLKKQSCGWLVFGVNNRKVIVGSTFRPQDAHLESLKGEISKHTAGNLTFLEIHELKLDEGRVVMFQIPPAPRGQPISWKGHFYGRHGDETGALTLQKLELIRTQTGDWSSEICPDALPEDLDPQAIKKARHEFKSKHPKLAEDAEKWDDVTFLNKTRLARQGKITRAALILLGREEAEHFLLPAQARITWVLKDDKGREKDYAHFGAPFILNVEKVLSKIRNLNYRYLPDGTLFPIEITQYDPWVIREALHNCIAHQNYELHGRINVVESTDALLFTNLGSFLPGSVERVIEQDSPPDTYRNHFLADAMVNLNMIDTIGSGIRKMFLKQKERFFPLPDYDLKSSDSVELRVQGKIIDPNYTQLLVQNPDMDLSVAMLLDKVQKRMRLSKEQHLFLKKKDLVEGRYPNLYLAAHVVALTGDKTSYIKNRAFHDRYYKDMVLAYISEFKQASRRDIDKLLFDHLSDALSEKQKMNKIRNILYSMSKKDEIIKNIGSSKNPKWVLCSGKK